MFSSPVKTPRRGALSSRLLSRDSQSRAGSILASERDHPTTPSIRSSRLGIVQRGSPTSSAGETVRTYREDGGVEKAFWSRDERHAVTSLGGLPGEVQKLIKGIDLVVEPIHGYLDRETGFAFVATSEGCITWNYTKRTHSSPTCYTFPSPPPAYALTAYPAVLAALYTASSEPGMILVGATGEIRFWESMSLALANVERYQSTQLELGSDDIVDKIRKCDNNTFIITTTSSLAFRLTIISSGGRLIPNVSAFTRPGGIFGRASSAIFGGRSVDDKNGIVAVASTLVSSGGVAYLMTRRSMQKWQLSSDGAARFIQDFDLYDAIGSALFGQDSANWLSGNIGLELNDLVAVGDDELAVLVSYTEQQPGSSTYPRIHNSHAIVLFTIHPKSNTLMVSRVVPVSYLAHPDPRMLDVPRLVVPFESSIAFIHFSDVIVTVSMAEGAPYEEVISLKDTAKNAFIGVGCYTASPINSKRSIVPCLIAMPASGGLMQIEVDANAGRAMALSSQASATARLKSKMEQAVFFGDRTDNPLSFDLPAGFQGDAAEAAENVSAEIVASTSIYMPSIFELRPQLSDRLQRLKELITFIRKNGLLSILPQSTRRRLSRDAEKIRAAIDLWDHQNRLMDQMHSRSPQSLLSDSITLYMDQMNIGEEDDMVRVFFRTQVQNLDRLLETVFGMFRSVVTSADQRTDLTPWVIEANRIFMIVIKAASRFRESEVSTYEINKLKPVEEVWTAQESFIDAMEYLYFTTERLIRDRTRDLGSAIDEHPVEGGPQRSQQVTQVTLKTQMADLAAALCTNMEEKIRCLVNQVEQGADPQAGMAVMQRWAEMKPKIIRPLINIDKIKEAYELAEHHSDFQTLVYLCTSPIAGMGQARIQTYIEKFGPEYAFPLYQWYIDQGQLHTLLSQDEVYGGLLTNFFETRNYPELAWMHHIACRRYGEAGSALLAVQGSTNELAQKHLVSSIGKLAAIAEIKSKGDTSSRKQLVIDLESELDNVQVQNTLRETILNLSTTAEPSGYRPPPSIQKYTTDHAKALDKRPAFRALFVEFGQKLIEGDALELEELVDVLTMKDNYGEALGDSAIALERLMRDISLPEGRKQVTLISIWRRIFIRDDWSTLANTKGRSEEGQRQLQRQTLTYHTIQLINRIKDFPRTFILSPYTSIQPPLTAELAARFPDKSAEEIERIMVDYEDEIRVLEGLITGSSGLEERVREVMELVKRDVEDDGDVLM